MVSGKLLALNILKIPPQYSEWDGTKYTASETD